MSRPTSWMAALAAALALSVAGGVSPPLAQDGRAPSWSEVKCARYAKGWTDALARRGV